MFRNPALKTLLKPLAAMLAVVVGLSSQPVFALSRIKDLASVEGKASVVTHVPDGIGPITTACLFENVVAAAAQAGR